MYDLDILDNTYRHIEQREEEGTEYDKFKQQQAETDKYTKSIMNSIHRQMLNTGLSSFFNKDRESQQNAKTATQSSVPKYYPAKEPQQDGNGNQRGAMIQDLGNNGKMFAAYPNSKAAKTGNPDDDRFSDVAISKMRGLDKIEEKDIKFLIRIHYNPRDEQLLIKDEQT